MSTNSDYVRTLPFKFSADNWDLLIREMERLQDVVKHKTLLADSIEHSKGIVTQKLNESLTESARLERELQASRATVEANARTITDLTAQLTEERLNASAMRVHLEACTALMRGPSQLHTARNLLDTARDTMEACTRMMERAGRE